MLLGQTDATTNIFSDLLGNLGLGNLATTGLFGLVIGAVALWFFWRWWRD